MGLPASSLSTPFTQPSGCHRSGLILAMSRASATARSAFPLALPSLLLPLPPPQPAPAQSAAISTIRRRMPCLLVECPDDGVATARLASRRPAAKRGNGVKRGEGAGEDSR